MVRTTNAREADGMEARPFSGRVALVTGASSGIGRAVASMLVDSGAHVAVGARRRDRLDALAGDVGQQILALELDVTDPDSVKRAIDDTVEHFGRLDILVNNAGVMLSGLIAGADINEWTRMVNTNLLGSMYAVHAALPHLVASGGAVVQVSSTSARSASLGSGVYAATKSGISAFSESLRQEVTEQGVRVIVIQPGFVTTELVDHITDPTMRARAASIAASMRTLQPDDVANAVRWALGQPDHVAVNEILVRPTDQTI